MAAKEGGQQYIEEKSETEKIVRNSPYGADRGSFGWGTPFKAAARCFFDEIPQVFIGLSSLNAVPGKDRDMSHMLQQYMKKFSIMEHCNPYHRMGTVEVWQQWKSMPGKRPFLFTIKSNQYLTHTRMLEIDADTSDHIKNFFQTRCLETLGERFGAALLQLPPQFHNNATNLERLKAVGAQMPPNVRIAVEFRHKSWFVDEVYNVLRGLKWALVVTHNHDVGTSPLVETGADFMYVRLHGAVGRYVGDYGPAQMDLWAEKVAAFLRDHPDRKVFFFFNNNESAVSHLTSSVVDATYLAQKLKSIMTTAGATTSGPVVAAPAPPSTAEKRAHETDAEGPTRPPGPTDMSSQQPPQLTPQRSQSKPGAPPPGATVEVIE